MNSKVRPPKVGRRTSRLGALAFAGLLSVGTFALTASNSVPASKAGDGSGVISGYTVSNVKYTLAVAAPANIDFVTFDLDAAATTVKTKVVSTGTTYTDCVNTVANTWKCDFTTDPTVASANQLSVVATS